MFESNIKDNSVANYYENKKKKLYERYNVYLKILDKRLKKFAYLEKHNKCVPYLNSSDNTFLDENDYSIIEHSDKYRVASWLTKNNTIRLKQLLKNTLCDKISNQIDEVEHILTDQKIYKTLGKIKLRYIGLKIYYQINENHKSDFVCLSLKEKTIYAFEIIDDNFDKGYIFYSDYTKKFYKTNEFIKLNYMTIDNYEVQLEIIANNEDVFDFTFSDTENNNINTNKYFWIDYNPLINIYQFSEKSDKLYTKNIYIKSIQK